MQLTNGSILPSGYAAPRSRVQKDVAAASSTEKALLLVHHPFKADQDLPRLVALQAQEAILEEGLTELLLHLLLGHDHGEQQLPDDEEMLWPTCCRRTVLCIYQSPPPEITRSLSRKDHAAHMLTLRVDQDRVLGGLTGGWEGVSDLGLDTTPLRAPGCLWREGRKGERPHDWNIWTLAWWVEMTS